MDRPRAEAVTGTSQRGPRLAIILEAKNQKMFDMMASQDIATRLCLVTSMSRN